MRNYAFTAMEEFKEAEKYWLAKLSGELSEVKLYGDFPRTKQYSPGKYSAPLGREETIKLLEISKNNDLSLYILLLVTLKILLFKYLGQEDLIVVSPIYSPANRKYNNYILFRDTVHAEMTFKDLLTRVKDTVVEGYKNEHFSTRDLMAQLELQEEMSLSRVVLLLENIHPKELITDIGTDYENDIVLSFRKNDTILEAEVIYNSGVFASETAQRMLQGYQYILNQVLNDTGMKISTVEMMPGEEKNKIFHDFNHTTVDYPENKTLYELFAGQVEKTPHRAAVSVVPDLSEIYAELKAETINPHLMETLGKCYCKKNPFVFTFDVETTADSKPLKLLKTHRHTCVIVNNNIVELLKAFDGERSIGGIFSQLKELNLEFYIYPIKIEDLLEISCTFTHQVEKFSGHRFEEFIRLIKMLYTNFLIDLKGIYFPGSPEKPLDSAFDENETFDESFILDDLFNRSNRVSPAEVLLIGDTPGMPSVGLLYMASYLWRNGIKARCHFHDLNGDYVSLKKNIEALLDKIKPRWVGVSMKWFPYMARVLEICKIVKAHSPQIKIILGANTASYYTEKVIRYDFIDYVVRGDGEVPLLKICQEADYLPNCVYKKDGKIIENPITFVHNESNSKDIYLSHLDQILISRYASLFGTFFIPTQKGCTLSCCYCGGCKVAQEKAFGRKGIFKRGIEEVRKDLLEAKKYASMFMFDLIESNEYYVDYFQKITAGIDLSNYLCVYGNYVTPSAEIIDVMCQTFNYVYWELDMASLSERHRDQLVSLNLVKIQTSDEEILEFYNACEKYENGEVRMNLIAGLPYFNREDVEASDNMLKHILKSYRCFSDFHWGRLHAQPGAPITYEADKHDMHSYATTYEDFLKYSEMNFNRELPFPGVEDYNYPYVYFLDEKLNSAVSSHSVETRAIIKEYKEKRREGAITGNKMTYRQLNRWVRELAGILRRKGVKTDSVVGLIMESSLEMVAGILAVLSTGAGYLPLDPAYPPERKTYILKDSHVKTILIQRRFSAEHKDLLESLSIKNVISVDDNMNKPGETPSPANGYKPGHPAYVIYTSGTTGRPRGVLVEHKGLVNYASWRIRAYGLTENDVTLQPLSYCFDGFGSNFYSTLLSGGTLVMIPDSKKMDYEYIKEVVKQEGVTNISLVPPMYDALLNHSGEEDLSRLRFVVLGGEQAPASLIHRSQKKNPAVRHIIEYGPTEASIGAAANLGVLPAETAVIGKPIDNTSIYISDQYHQPLPPGVPGELSVAGPGLARGYLNNPELTAEKFFVIRSDRSESSDKSNRPYLTKKLYKTGDLARWLPEGKIEFLGRIDHQVKIRGFRIELGEIESRLSKHPEVKNAVVITRENSLKDKYLCAYIVAHPGSFGKIPDDDELREYLALELPGYMIPSHFVRLEKIPLNSNGKIDMNALPEPGTQSRSRDNEAPGNEIEEKLVEIWSEVLGSEPGINDNFFKIGGDSIKAIQVSARLKAYQWELKINDLFSNPTIKQAAKCVKKGVGNITQRIHQQDIVEGPVPLTPIQQWFFENFPGPRHHFNHAVILYSESGFDEKVIKRVFAKLIEHHDALRMVYKIDGNEILQENRGLDGPLYDLEAIDCRDSSDVEAKITGEADRIQQGIDLKTGPLVKLGLFRTRPGDYLLIVIHHLVLDGVSWRILLEDFSTGYTQAASGEPVRFPGKTHSFKKWAQRLKEYAVSPVLLNQLPYWQAVDRMEVKSLPKDNRAEPDRLVLENKERRTLMLTAAETAMLLKEIHHAYNTEINDILLAALAMALEEWTGLDRVAINLEGHGREEIMADIDIGRTLGWFTAQFPVVLDLSESQDLSFRIKEVKEILRRIPNKGIGYGILRYLTPPQQREGTRFDLRPEISFNYLGQFRQEPQNQPFQVSPLEAGNQISPKCPQHHAIDINGLVTEDRLNLVFTYNRFQYKKTSIEKFAACYRSNLLAIIEHCQGKTERELTPSDLTYPGLSTRQLEQLRDRTGMENAIEDLYPLSPMQGGLYFHALKEEASHAYFEQNVISLEGKIDVPLFEESLNILIRRYDVLRTSFVHESLEEPLQIVFQQRPLKITFEDLSSLSAAERETSLEIFKLKDKERGFDLSRDLLMRIALFLVEKEPHRYKLLFSFHHILMDGWCLGILLKNLRRIYPDLKQDRLSPGELPPVTPYKKYIQWLSAWDKQEALRYWHAYLEGYEQEIGLPGAAKGRDNTRESHHIELYRMEFPAPVSRGLDQVAKEHQVTVNIVFRTLWGILLRRYNNADDVVFGAVVAGRPTDIEDVENMVGLFINTLPVRIRPGKIKTVSGLLREVQRQSAEATDYQYLSLAEIQSVSLLKNRLIQHLVVFENYPLEEALAETLPGQKDAGIGFEIVGMESKWENDYDFNLIVIPGEQYQLVFNYNAAVFDKKYIENISRHWEILVKQFLLEPDLEIQEIDITTPEEKQEILVGFNDSTMETVYPPDQTLHRLFEEQAAKSPDHIALSGARQISYRELREKSRQLAAQLQEKGIGPDTIAAIALDRSSEMVIGILGILQAGGAYLPIEPIYPLARIKFMIGDSNARVVLTHQPLAEALKNSCEIIDLESPARSNKDKSNLMGTRSNAANLAYIIYTSGSTGKPKGVMIRHFSAVNLLFALQQAYPVERWDTYLLKTPYVFDVAVTELFGWFMGDGKLTILEKGAEKNPQAILNAIARNRVTHINFVPSMFRVFLELLTKENIGQIPGLKYIFLAGEAILPGLVEKFRILKTTVALENIYGPTEGTVYSSKYSLSGWNGNGNVPIGKPLQKVKLFILGKDNHLQPVGVPGELCIAGIGLARGYLNRPQLTAERFCLRRPGGALFKKTAPPGPPDKNFFLDHSPIYKSGDLGRWQLDGNIEFLGRIDHQVKIRGNRVELGEIENYLLKFAGIRDAAVTVNEDGTGDHRLAAYIVSGNEPKEDELREYLLKALPDYMVPSYFTRVDQMPLTSTGKVNRSALPAPGTQRVNEYAEPGDPVEKALVEIWSDVLGRKKEFIGTQENFFKLGGHSLKAAALALKIHKFFDVKMSFAEIFARPTIRRLSEYIKRAVKIRHNPVRITEEKEYYELSSAQKRLYYIQQIDKKGTAYHITNAWVVDGIIEKERLEKTLKKLARKHESLRTAFPLINGELCQRIFNEIDLQPDYSEIPGDNIRQSLVLNDFVKPFDLAQAPLLRMGLLHTPDNFVLLVDMHHIITDGISMKILIRDFMELYEGKESAKLSIRYKDFSQWQNNLSRSVEWNAQQEYWQKEFAGEIPVLDLPMDYPRPAVQAFKGSQISFILESEETSALNEIAKENQATLFMLMLALYNILLSKLSGEADVVVGTPIAGRWHEDLQQVVGLFVNTLALRNYPAPEKSFTDFLKEVREKTLQAFENQDYQFEDLVELTGVPRELNRHPVFTVIFSMQHPETLTDLSGDLKLKPLEAEGSASKVDLTFYLAEEGEKLHISFEYCTALFTRSTIQRFISYFQEIIAQTLANRSIKLEDINISHDLYTRELVVPQDDAENFGF